ncbi:hypothetical protein AB205_0027620, partial [Aquarana catesbeiana]
YVQSGNLEDYNIVVKEEFQEDDGEYGVIKELSEGHKNLTMKPPNNRKPPERRPCPLYSWDSTQEGHSYHNQVEDLMDIKVKLEAEEEMYGRDDQQSMEEDGIIRIVIEEDTPTEISTGKSYLSQYQSSHTEEKPYCCSECGKCFSKKEGLQRHQKLHTNEKPFSCSECGKSFQRKSQHIRHQIYHSGKKPYSCEYCGHPAKFSL